MAEVEGLEKGIGISFVADGGGRSVAGDDKGGVREGEQAVLDRAEEGAGVTAGKVGAAHAAGEEGVAGEEQGGGG